MSNVIISPVYLIMVLVLIAGFFTGAIVERTLTDDVVCPPIIEASTKLRLYFDEMPPEPTELDNEFAELCGVGGWTNPVKEAPPEEGGA